MIWTAFGDPATHWAFVLEQDPAEEVGAEEPDSSWDQLEEAAEADELTVAQLREALALLGESVAPGSKKADLRADVLAHLEARRAAAEERLPVEEQRQRQRGAGPACPRCRGRDTFVNQTYPVGSRLGRAYPAVIAARRVRRDCECGSCGHQWTFDS